MTKAACRLKIAGLVAVLLLFMAELALRLWGDPLRRGMPGGLPVLLQPYLMFGPLYENPGFAENGLERDRPPFLAPLPSKERGEVRIEILGSSDAYGTGASSREACWDRRLERILNARKAPGDARVFRVVNRARQGYNTTQAWISLCLEALEDDPDHVVFPSGVMDLTLPLVQHVPVGDPTYLSEARAQMRETTWARLRRDLHQHLRLVQVWKAIPSPFAGRTSAPASGPAPFEARGEVLRVAARNVRLMGDQLSARRIRGLLVAPPVLPQKPASPEELAHAAQVPWAEALGREYPIYQRAVLQAGRESGWEILDAMDLFREVPGRRFVDMVHLDDAGQEALAAAVADALAPGLGLPQNRK